MPAKKTTKESKKNTKKIKKYKSDYRKKTINEFGLNLNKR